MNQKKKTQVMDYLVFENKMKRKLKNIHKKKVKLKQIM